MTLLELLKLYEKDFFPPVVSGKEIDTRPESIFKITVCFMCESETWLTCNIQNEILIPWYDCEVSSIQPDPDNCYSIAVWLKDVDYILEKFGHCVIMEEENEKTTK